MKLFKKVAIIGTGLIGGSICLDLKKKRLAKEIIGVSRHKATLSKALHQGIIDRGSQDIRIIRGADLVILAMPVSAILQLAPQISKIISPECIVTDVGSTKQEIASLLEKLFPNYVGSHPLAGSEKRGIAFAKANLFKNSLCILTPTKRTNQSALRKIKDLWLKLGAKVRLLNPSGHDKILSFTSHLPHTVAFSLINAIPQKYFCFSSSGLKDTTRIAASEAELWSDIFLSNRKNLLHSISVFQKNICEIRSAIQKNDSKTLNRLLKEAKQRRNAL